MDETIYKRSSSGKKISKSESRNRRLQFNDKTMEMTRTVKIGRDRIYVNSNPLKEKERKKLQPGYKIKIGNTVLDIL